MDKWTVRRANREYKKYTSQENIKGKVLSYSEWIQKNVQQGHMGSYGEVDRWGHDLLNRHDRY
jgi:hypothetical protein